MSGTDRAAGLALGTAYGGGAVLGMAWGLPLTHSWVRLHAGQDQQGWDGGRASPRAGPALQGVKIPDADGVPCPCRAAVSVKLSPRQGGSLNFGAPGCAERLAKAPSCPWANGIAGGLLTGQRATRGSWKSQRS